MEGCAVEQIRHREIHFTAARPAPDLLALRTVDDVFAVAAAVAGIDRTRASLDRLRAAVRRADLTRAMTVVRTITGSRPSRQIDVTASFVGRRNYNRFEIEDTVGDAITRFVGGTYHTRASGGRPPAGTTSWRVTIEDQRAVIALRLSSRPLHRRDWKRASIPGTLHPPVAAAMVALAELRPGDRVLDPCCGAGTLLVEAASVVPRISVYGSDICRTALIAAGENVTTRAHAHMCVADAGALPVGDASVDRILVNPPWQGQVDARLGLSRNLRRLWTEARRVVRADGLIVALLDDADVRLPDLTAGGGWLVERRIPLSLFGRHPEIVVARPTGTDLADERARV
ncbi:MAG TPA: methyltransferase domain-containing protein [Actinopolymorphaceae bacterium]|nr:methyltransferase domain-containing protein [Actinopolymorphaceae bacterium]